LTEKIDTKGNTTAYTYDGLGRLLTTTVSGDGSANEQVTMAYTLTGRKLYEENGADFQIVIK